MMTLANKTVKLFHVCFVSMVNNNKKYHVEVIPSYQKRKMKNEEKKLITKNGEGIFTVYVWNNEVPRSD